MSSSFYMILDMLVAMAALGYGGPLPRRLPFALHRTARNSSSIKSSNKTTVSFASLGINDVPKSSTGSVFRYIV